MNNINKSSEQIETWYKIHNIVFEKAELYCDFFISLIELINSTYPGHDVTKTEEDKKGHFKWCFNKVIDSFGKEQIYFNRTGLHFDYLWSFFKTSFYYSNDETNINSLIKYFKEIFHINYLKSNMELDMLENFYKILDKNLKN